MTVEPRHYRLHFLNGCDSRFLALEFMAADLDATDLTNTTSVGFLVIGADQGMGPHVEADEIVVAPAERYDIIVDFSAYAGQRIIIKNTGGDEPFGGEVPGPQLYERTDCIMAFDVTESFDASIPDDFDVDLQDIEFEDEVEPDNVRHLGLFEGHDQFGRLQPLLGTIGPAVDMDGNDICYPNDQKYKDAGLIGPMEGTMTWHGPTTENIKLNDVEDWEIWNLSADAHPIHVHLVHFNLVRRELIKFDSGATEDGEIEPENLADVVGDGTYFVDMPLVQHDGSMGEGYKAINPTKVPNSVIDENSEEYQKYVDNFPKDVIIALPGQVTTIRAHFDKPGRFNWHCHILAHEDHEMMRIFHVGELPESQRGGTCPGEEPLVENPPDSGSIPSCTVSFFALLITVFSGTL
jgi:spore coat protein A